MMWIIAMVDKPVEARTIRANLHRITAVDIQADALKREGKGAEAARLLRAHYGGTVIDDRLVQEMGRLKDEVYENRRKPFSPPSSVKPLWESLDGILARTSGLDEKYFDVVKDPRSDTLYAAITLRDSIVLYRGVVNYSSRSISWSRWTSYSYSGDLRNPDMAIDGNYVYVAFSKVFSSTDHDPRLLKVRRSDATKYMYYLSLAGDFEDFPTVTTDYETYSSAVWVYYAYWNANKDSVMFVRIDNPDTTTYTSYGGIAYAIGDTGTANRMSIDHFYSSGAKLFLAYMTNGDTVLLATSSFGSSWTARSASFGKGLFPHVKGRRGGPYVGVVYTYPYSSTDYDCYIQYSTDGGSSFNWHSCGTTLDDELWPTMAFAADTVWVSYLYGDKDTPVDSITDTMRVIVAALPLSGGYYIYKDSINDPSFKYGVLTTWHPVITSSEDTLISEQFLHVAWSRRWNNTNDFDVRYDYHFFTPATGIEEAPSVAENNVVVVKGGLKVKGTYRIYDPAGRLVGSGQSSDYEFVPLRRGSYFVKTQSGLRSIVIR